MKQEAYIISVVCWCLLEIVYSKHVQNENTLCPMDQYFDKTTNHCRICSVCPKDYIINVPCRGFQDTVCGKFVDFASKFSSKNFHIGSEATVGPKEQNGSEQQQGPEDNEPTTGVFEMSDEWYIISMVLLGILCLAGAAITVYIVLACFVCKKQNQEKEIVYEPEFISPASSSDFPKNIDNYVTPSSFPVRHKTTLTSISEEAMHTGEPLLHNGSLYVNYEYIEPKDSLLLQCVQQAEK